MKIFFKIGTNFHQENHFIIQAFSLQWETHLLDPEILRKGSELYLTVAIWLQLQLEKSAKVQSFFSSNDVPRYLVLKLFV